MPDQTRDHNIYKELLSKLIKVINLDQVSGLPVLVKEVDLISMQVRLISTEGALYFTPPGDPSIPNPIHL